MSSLPQILRGQYLSWFFIQMSTQFQSTAKVYLGSSQTSMMELFASIVYDFCKKNLHLRCLREFEILAWVLLRYKITKDFCRSLFSRGFLIFQKWVNKMRYNLPLRHFRSIILMTSYFFGYIYSLVQVSCQPHFWP